MKSVLEILKSFPNVVLIQRHGQYFLQPLMARLVKEGVDPGEAEMVALARNYSRVEHPSTFALNSAGIETSRKQGKMLAEAGIEIDMVYGSTQGRGPDTGLFICEGYCDVCATWLPFETIPKLDYPVYDYELLLQAFKAKEDKQMVGEWLNGKRSNLITSKSPEGFKSRIKDLVEKLLKEGGKSILTTHYEILVLAHALFVDQIDLGRVSEAWQPEKSGGVVVWIDDEDQIQGRDYDPVLKLI